MSGESKNIKIRYKFYVMNLRVYEMTWVKEADNAPLPTQAAKREEELDTTWMLDYRMSETV